MLKLNFSGSAQPHTTMFPSDVIARLLRVQPARLLMMPHPPFHNERLCLQGYVTYISQEAKASDVHGKVGGGHSIKKKKKRKKALFLKRTGGGVKRHVRAWELKVHFNIFSKVVIKVNTCSFCLKIPMVLP